MSNEINYEIDNCITDLDTLKILDKRAARDLENNTHEIEQQEVLTIIREFIRLRNDYNKEKEKNRQSKMRIVQLENEITARIEDVNKYFISKDKIRELIDKRGINGYTSLDCIEDIEELLEERK